MSKFSVPKSWKNCYAIVDKETGKLPLIQASIPIYWSRKVANERIFGFTTLMVKKISSADLQKFISK